MKILALGAHPDDIEISCGGFISRMIRERHEVICIALSDCGMNEIHPEMRESMNILGVTSSWVCAFKRRVFPMDRQGILRYFIYIKDTYGPFDIILTHDESDKHQDHSTVAQETIRAFGTSTILTYKSPFNSLCLDENYFVKIDEEDLDRKIEALKCYKSQTGRVYMGDEVIRSQAVFRGLQAGCKFAEAFKLIRTTV